MLYDIDSFGFVFGYLKNNWSVMSRLDLLNDSKLIKELARVEYEDWKKHNILELKERWENYGTKHYKDFEEFCNRIYKKRRLM